MKVRRFSSIRLFLYRNAHLNLSTLIMWASIYLYCIIIADSCLAAHWAYKNHHDKEEKSRGDNAPPRSPKR